MQSKIKLSSLAVIFVFFSVGTLFAIDAKVVSIVGKAEVKTETSWVKLSPGDEIKTGDVVSTGFKSEVVLKIGNSTFVVQPLSRITIEQLKDQGGNHTSQMFLDTGSIKADVKPAENKRVGFTVRSPVATASVRGTGGIIKANGSIYSTENTWQVWETSADEAFAIVKIDEGDTTDEVFEYTQPPADIKSIMVSETQSGIINNGEIKTAMDTSITAALGLPSTTKTKAEEEARVTTTGAVIQAETNTEPTQTSASVEIQVKIITD